MAFVQPQPMVVDGRSTLLPTAPPAYTDNQQQQQQQAPQQNVTYLVPQAPAPAVQTVWQQPAYPVGIL